MFVLVTAGNTLAPIDRVRGITNRFTGRTGARIAHVAHSRGHRVLLLTSRPETVGPPSSAADRWEVRGFQTFDDLQAQLADQVPWADIDAMVHSAAVSDHACVGTYAPSPGTRFVVEERRWLGPADGPALDDIRAGKVGSSAPEVWLRLVPAPKLVDRVRSPWGFAGILVKFKLEVDVDTAGLLAIAEASRQQSQADLMVANTFAPARAQTWLGPIAGAYERVRRALLAERLLDEVERLHRERNHG